jgi:UDP-N-acetylmuramate-alanine ligase
LETYKSYYYFIGIGGIGMSALARHFKEIGARIAGYDKTSTDLTQALENEGIHVSYEDEPPNKGYFKSLAPQEGHGIKIKESGKAHKCKLTNGK